MNMISPSGSPSRSPVSPEIQRAGNDASAVPEKDTVNMGASQKAARFFSRITHKAYSMPSWIGLEEAFKKALQEGGVSDGNPLDSTNVKNFRAVFENGIAKPGDIILVGNNAKPELSMLDSLVPGNYSHVGIYIGTNDKGEHQTIDAWVPGATIRIIDWWPVSYNRWSVIRPQKPDGSEITEEERQKIVDFAKSAEGCAYNMDWVENVVELPVVKEKSKFYCSQLAWASCFYGAGIDIDANPGFHPKYAKGVAPQELRDSHNIKVVAEEDNSPGMAHPETLLRLGGGAVGVLASTKLAAWALRGTSTGIAVGGVFTAGLAGGVLGIWLGKILYQSIREHIPEQK